MFRFVGHCAAFVLTLLLLGLVTVNPTKSNNVDPVLIVDFNGADYSDFEDQSEELELFSSSKLTVIPASNADATLRYRIGKRIPHDRIVSQNKDKYRWDAPQNVTLILQYPSSGQGAIVTYVEITVEQSSNLGRAHVLTGGIGQRFIVTIVEGNSTKWFNYSSKIYGI